MFLNKNNHLAVFLLILFFGFLTLLPSDACDYAPTSSVKANMHTLQTMLEIYRVDHGKYPSDVLTLKKEAVRLNYWKVFRNPFTYEIGIGKAYMDIEASEFDKVSGKIKVEELERKGPQMHFGLRVVEKVPLQNLPTKGTVLYRYISETSYKLYGIGADKSQMMKDRSSVFFLNDSF